jgi:acetyl-CoA carboxylase biotin carboxylase subunit
MRRRIGEAAVALARAGGYVNAGTMEFLLDRHGNVYFLEMNSRLQVEHPVTEMVTGIDLVKEQIRIAAGEPLRLRQEDLRIQGHAIECRIYAEDPFQNFIPSPGVIRGLREPGGPGVRVESGVYQGYEVPVFYDPLISKIVAWGRDRTEAVERMRRALAETVVKGIKTTVPFHRWVMGDPAYMRGQIDTSFIDTHFARRAEEEGGRDRDVALIAAALRLYLDEPPGSGAARAEAAPARESAWRIAARRDALRRL